MDALQQSFYTSIGNSCPQQVFHWYTHLKWSKAAYAGEFQYFVVFCKLVQYSHIVNHIVAIYINTLQFKQVVYRSVKKHISVYYVCRTQTNYNLMLNVAAV